MSGHHAIVASRERFRVLRSKNIGPWFLTFDIVLLEQDDFAKIVDRLTAADLATAYGVTPENVTKPSSQPELRAIKVSILRRIPAGHPGCSDYYGMNQEEPLARLLLRLLERTI